MILDTLNNSALTEQLHPLFKQLFDYVKTHDLTQVPAERIVLEADDLFINIADATLKTADEQKLEIHREYIDVHFPLSGDEIVGWTPKENLKTQSEAPFNEQEDFALYAEQAETYFTVSPGQFLVVYPNDAHAPIIGEGTLRKAIAKVRIR